MENSITDYLLSQAWICVEGITKEKLYQLLEIVDTKTLSFEDAYEKIVNRFDEKIFLNFQVENYEFILGKYFFLSSTRLKSIIKTLGKNSKNVFGFAIDPWSAYYSFIIGKEEAISVFFEANDEKITQEGNLSELGLGLNSKYTENEFWDLAEKLTCKFEMLDKALTNNHKMVKLLFAKNE